MKVLSLVVVILVSGFLTAEAATAWIVRGCLASTRRYPSA